MLKPSWNEGHDGDRRFMLCSDALESQWLNKRLFTENDERCEAINFIIYWNFIKAAM